MKINSPGMGKRLRAYKHNGYSGYVAMAHRQMQSIYESDTATLQAKNTAHSIMMLLEMLKEEIKERVD